MHTNQKLHISSTSLEQSLKLGRRLGEHCQPGQVIELKGNLGGGKTVVVKGIAAGLGIEQTITSPTFSIQRSYAVSSGSNLEHFDLYRLAEGDIVEEGIAEAISDGNNIVVVEWPKPFIASLKSDRLIITLDWLSDSVRTIIIEATGQQSQKLIEALK